ncbi:hypothetical protein B1H58_01245 [Pantoea alhagi]|uniref:Uncharacterized protein n=1 Tax=Pantoea alhagi TaxID=1891675 RepID=A0A1W6B0Z9_9GAMM|nr:hypothetical protein [Pantoea alhagi]ARJ40755.1 hypothetical protein B1H58_01245 [Pantoea alhagi]
MVVGIVYYWQRQRDRKDMDPASESMGNIRLICIIPPLTVAWILILAMRQILSAWMWRYLARGK